jgi:RNA-directed DNA polymerase
MGKPPTTEQGTPELTLREVVLPEKLRVWRAKLSTKAKQEKRFRFYSLYGLISHPVTLQAAWEKVLANDGAPGVDGISPQHIEREGVGPFLEEIRRALAEKRYRCAAVRRVYIPKANGKLRPLGIPTVRDRVVQTAALLILEPIFEADFEECSFGFRPGRSAQQALEVIRKELKRGRTTVYDADLEKYFDTIPHDKLMACLRMRVVDGSVLALIGQWLQAVVVEKGEKGKPPTIKRNGSGTPQGGVISPLLANIYLHWFDHLFHRAGSAAQQNAAALVRYADDLVVLTRQKSEAVQAFIEEKLEGWLGLKINREKTRVVNLREEGMSLDFLGYRFGLDWDRFGRKRRYWNLGISKAALLREQAKLREMIGPRQCWKPLPELVDELNAHLRGWANYFAHGYARRGFRQINSYVRDRLAGHLKRRSQRPWRAPQGVSVYHYLNERLGLIQL